MLKLVNSLYKYYLSQLDLIVQYQQEENNQTHSEADHQYYLALQYQALHAPIPLII